jgi:hypothetical protein
MVMHASLAAAVFGAARSQTITAAQARRGKASKHQPPGDRSSAAALLIEILLPLAFMLFRTVSSNQR